MDSKSRNYFLEGNDTADSMMIKKHGRSLAQFSTNIDWELNMASNSYIGNYAESFINLQTDDNILKKERERFNLEEVKENINDNYSQRIPMQKSANNNKPQM